MNMKEIEALLLKASFDSVIEIECEECGALITAEPDASDLFCEACERVTMKNPLTQLGFV